MRRCAGVQRGLSLSLMSGKNRGVNRIKIISVTRALHNAFCALCKFRPRADGKGLSFWYICIPVFPYGMIAMSLSGVSRERDSARGIAAAVEHFQLNSSGVKRSSLYTPLYPQPLDDAVWRYWFWYIHTHCRRVFTSDQFQNYRENKYNNNFNPRNRAAIN